MNSVHSEILPPLSERFESASEETPNFQRHVIPLLGRLGCNGRACHGSFQGRGGFALSLFGYDFKADHDAMTSDDFGRVDLDDVSESLILYKPTDAELHEGGKRFDVDSWQYRVLEKWIAEGATHRQENIQTIEHLAVTPASITRGGTFRPVQLRVVAQWPDGTSEDVTELCRFSSRDDAIATVDQNGLVRGDSAGDTHLVVAYDNAVVTVPYVQPIAPEITKRVAAAQQVESSKHPVDQLISRKHRQLGLVPSGRCSDADFIRRVSLNLTGLLPAADEVQSFLDDRSSNKREHLIDELMETEGYAAWWATKLSDWTGNNAGELTQVIPVRNAGGRMWYEWLRARVAENMPYDEIVERIVVATSRDPDESYRDYCESMSRASQPGGESEFASRECMPLYWGRRNFQTSEDRAIGFAYSFLGLSIQCAQCHKHPFDQWTQNDFTQFANVFTPVQYKRNTVPRESVVERDALLNNITGGKKSKNVNINRLIQEAGRKGDLLPYSELIIDDRQARRRKKSKQKNFGADRVPRGTILGEDERIQLDQDPRDDLMAWLRDPDNPYFAAAIVNRVWDNHFGVGIVSPTDDLNLANPPSIPGLLEYLCQGFIDSGFDLQWLHRTILMSDAYQRGHLTNETNLHDRRNFARYIPHRLPAEAIADALALATIGDKRAQEMRLNLEDLAIANARPANQNRGDFAMQVFGQSTRESNCDCDRTSDPSLLQSIYLRNDRDIHTMIADRRGWAAQITNEMGWASVKTNSPPKEALERVEQRLWQISRVTNRPNLKPQQIKKYQVQYRSLAKRITDAGLNPMSLTELRQLEDRPESLIRNDDAQAMASKNRSIDEVIHEAYLRTLSRLPDEAELVAAKQIFEEVEQPQRATESLLWALVNTKEFILNH
ncbi:MAG: DUF1549 domain-containing protein [Planctomycetota bacterium]